MAYKNLAIVLKRSGKSKEVKINKDLDVTDINKSVFPEKYISRLKVVSRKRMVILIILIR